MDLNRLLHDEIMEIGAFSNRHNIFGPSPVEVKFSFTEEMLYHINRAIDLHNKENLNYYQTKLNGSRLIYLGDKYKFYNYDLQIPNEDQVWKDAPLTTPEFSLYVRIGKLGAMTTIIFSDYKVSFFVHKRSKIVSLEDCLKDKDINLSRLKA